MSLKDRNHENSEESNDATLNTRILSIENQGWKFLRNFTITLLVIYLATQPQIASVFIIEYFKFNPEITFDILKFAIPLLTSILIVRSLFLVWFFFLFHVFSTVYAALFIFLPIPIALFFKVMLRVHTNKWIRDLNDLSIAYIEKQIENVEKFIIVRRNNYKGRNLLKSNIILSIIFSIVFFIAQENDTQIAHRWNHEYNKKYLIVTNLHYNCQITGAYNSDVCDYWKNEYAEYLLNN